MKRYAIRWLQLGVATNHFHRMQTNQTISLTRNLIDGETNGNIFSLKTSLFSFNNLKNAKWTQLSDILNNLCKYFDRCTHNKFRFGLKKWFWLWMALKTIWLFGVNEIKHVLLCNRRTKSSVHRLLFLREEYFAVLFVLFARRIFSNVVHKHSFCESGQGKDMCALSFRLLNYFN